MKTQEVKVVVPQLSTFQVAPEDLAVSHYQATFSLIVALQGIQDDLFDECLDEVFAIEKALSFDSTDVLRHFNNISPVVIKRVGEAHIETFIKNEAQAVLDTEVSRYTERANLVEAVIDQISVVEKSKETISADEYVELIRFNRGTQH